MNITKVIEDIEKFDEENAGIVRKTEADYIDFPSCEFVVKRYLTILYENIHSNLADKFAAVRLKKHDAEWARNFCARMSLVKDGEITLEGIKFLDFIEARTLNRNQYRFNIIIGVFTVIMTIATIISVVK